MMDHAELAEKAAKEERNKQVVLDVYHKVLMPMNSAAAAELISPRYMQHSPLAEDGLEGLKRFLDRGRAEYPHISHSIKRILADGDYVVVHSHVKLVPDTAGFAVMDIFRLEDAKLVEHWDVIQPVPESSPNSNSMF